VRIFKTKWFSRFASREGIDDTKLAEAVRNMESGLVDADYGGGMIKQRIARDGEGKSGGYRSIIAFKSETHSVVRLGLCISPVGAFDGSRGIYPTGENINYSFVTYVTR
jgi:hypothetical protein